jgi:hypothetical protein
MTFDTFKTEMNGRFAEAVTHLNFITSLEPKEHYMEHSLEVKMFRGFFYVHLYAVLERTINDLVKTLISEIKQHKAQNCPLVYSLNALSQANSWKSLRDSRHSEIHNKAVSILYNIDSNNVFELEASHLLKNLSNVWAETIIDLLKLFGISNFSLKPIDQALINEIVEKRNEIAHGRESPVNIGERFRCAELRTKLSNLQFFCNKLLSHIELYCQEHLFIRECNRNIYNKSTLINTLSIL